MSENSDFPIALHAPQTDIYLRAVTRDDIFALQAYLWQERSIDRIDEFVCRILKYEQQDRGVGVVVMGNANMPIIGYGQVTQWVTCAEISDLIVHPHYQSRGYGTAMIQYLTRVMLEKRYSCVEIGVANSNPRALNLYRRLGYQDSYMLELDLGQGIEPVTYLRLHLIPYFSL